MKPSKDKGSTGADKQSARFLHLEDSWAVAEIVKHMLEREGFNGEVTVTTNRSGFEAALHREPFDLILCDHGLPGYDGFAALKLARVAQPLTPVIMLSGRLDDEQAVESLKNGATD